MATWARAAGLCRRACGVGSKGANVIAGEQCTAAAAPFRATQQLRGMASDHGPPVTYAGLTLYKPARWHVLAGEGMASLMWFWVFYRAYHDGSTLLFGHSQHFEHDDHDEHGSGHGKEHAH